MSKKQRIDPYKRIMLAAKKGVGVHLNADEVWNLSQDDAIATAADEEIQAERGNRREYHQP